MRGGVNVKLLPWETKVEEGVKNDPQARVVIFLLWLKWRKKMKCALFELQKELKILMEQEELTWRQREK
jgi:hypothetical protein